MKTNQQRGRMVELFSGSGNMAKAFREAVAGEKLEKQVCLLNDYKVKE